MGYSDYKLEQIIGTYRNYQQLCDIFFNLAPNLETKAKLEEILYKGGCNGFSFSSKISSKDNPAIEGQRRISMAYLLLTNPETFEFFIQNKLNLFHGTNANALPNILKFGLNSVDESEKRNINVTTGEKWSRIGGKRTFVSFTDVLDIAEVYAYLKPTEENNLLSFGALICTTTNDLLQVGTCRVASDISEVGVPSRVPLENIHAICVPADKVEFVKKIVDNDAIKVFAIDNITNKFYYVDTDSYMIYIYEEELEKFKNNLQENNNAKIFQSEEIKKIMYSRFLTKMKEKIEQIKSIMLERKEVNDNKKSR